MRTPIVLALAATLLAACTTPAEQAASMQREIDRKIVVYGPACNKLGYQSGSDPWRNCVLQLSTDEEARRYAGYPGYPGYPYRYPYRGFWYY
ncbi:hypothetical protein [Janthinobacterium fluminis]|uniref:Lipoprotein n=1 Tax=Janthinobacterium fluminis TaxID=2987524 RepID=A0ABT5K061_9BURK|nr:hypothetical protein [Janthinobacterium fluminis]MDC8758362.1 hypothetical protein [Janthinobacterium fluminis]